MFGLVLLTASNVFPDQRFAGLQRIKSPRGPQGIETDLGLLRLQQSEFLLKPEDGIRYTLLPKTEAHWVSKLCSRPSPQFEGTWEPTQADISVLESNLPRVTKLQR